MDGVFMRKLMKFLLIAQLVVCLLLVGTLIADRQTLREDLIRLHVVADSDSDFDQAVKLQVRDAVIHAAEQDLGQCADVQQAKAYLLSNLDTLEAAANAALRAAGSYDTATVTLCREEFPMRQYDTFSLPSGVYESLRVTIGSGQGRNWWCVVFPSMCVSAASEGVRDTAASAGFSHSLSSTLTGQKGYEISFFLLDCLGKLENLFHFG